MIHLYLSLDFRDQDKHFARDCTGIIQVIDRLRLFVQNFFIKPMILSFKYLLLWSLLAMQNILVIKVSLQ